MVGHKFKEVPMSEEKMFQVICQKMKDGGYAMENVCNLVIENEVDKADLLMTVEALKSANKTAPQLCNEIISALPEEYRSVVTQLAGIEVVEDSERGNENSVEVETITADEHDSTQENNQPETVEK